MRIQQQIIKNLVLNEDYHKQVIPFLKEDYFQDEGEKLAFNLVKKHYDDYLKLPTFDQLETTLYDCDGVSEKLLQNASEIFSGISNKKEDDIQWIVDVTEKFCKNEAIHLALQKSLMIYKDDSGKMDRGAIPGLLEDALSVSFDPSIGHDYFKDYESQYDYYSKVEDRLPFDIDILNKVTNGGIPKKTLSILLAGVHVGKTMSMCHMASSHLNIGKKVLYITLEMSESEIRKRIDANLLDIEIKDLGPKLERNTYFNRMGIKRKKTSGELVVKEYAPVSASVSTFRNLLNELRIKSGFVPDVIYIDYLNNCLSARLKPSNNMYEYVKSISEEVRGLAVSLDTRIVSATQLNRTGFKSSNPGMEDIAESFGVNATADFILSLVTNKELKSMNQITMTQLKNRYGNMDYFTTFNVGVDYTKMRLYDIGDYATEMNDRPLMDRSSVSKYDTLDKLKGINFG